MALKTEAIVEFLAKGADRLIRDFDKIGDEADDAGKKAARGGSLASQSMADWAIQTVSVGAAVAGAKVAARELYQAIGEGAELQLARQRFDALAGSINTTGDALLGKMTAATGSMYTNAQLIEGATDIISTGLAGNEKDVVRLATVVAELGLDMQQVILTFANNSKMRLDSLGLSVADVDARTQEFVATGMSMDEAFDAAVLEGLEARLELVGSAADTTAGKLKITETALQNANDEFKMNLAASFADDLDLVAVSAEGGGGALEEMAGLVGDKLPAALMRALPPLQDLRTNLLATQKFMDFFDTGEFSSGMRESTKETQGLSNSLFEQDQALRDAIEASRDATQQQQWFAEVTDRAAERARNEADEIMHLEQMQRDLAPATREATDRTFEWSEAGQEAVETSQYWAQANADLEKQMGGPFLQALEDSIDTTVDFTEVMLQQAAQGGASAEALGVLAAATGNYTDEQIEAAIETAAMIAKAEQLGQAVADGALSAEEALEAFRNFQQQLQEPYELEVVAETDKAMGDIEGVRIAADEAAGDRYIDFHIRTIGGAPTTAGPGQSGLPIGAGAGDSTTPHVGGRDTVDPTGGVRPGTDPNFATGTGGWMRVPGGAGQPFPVTVHGGEMLNVVPRGQQASGGSSAPYIDNRTYNIQGRDATALAMAEGFVERRRRSNDYMGAS